MSRQLSWERLQPRSANEQPQLPLPTAAASLPAARDLWLCVYLPRLALEVHTRLDPAIGRGAFPAAERMRPLVVVDPEDRLCRVLACDARAEALGVRCGVALNAALALVPQLHPIARDARRERAALLRLAGWSGQYTPRVSVMPPDALLLEVRGSLGLFGGADALQCRVRKAIAELGYTAQLGLAPTPLAASWLARAGEEEAVMETHALAGGLGPIPLACLRWPDAVTKALHEMGLRTVGDCMRLPRDGFARRLGAERLADLDRALGRRPDPRPDYVAPTRFTARIELPMAVQTLEPLGHALALLLGELSGFLRARDGGIQSLQLDLVHHAPPVTQVSLNLARPQRERGHLLQLMMTRLEGVVLRTPVLSLRLRSGPVLRVDPRTAELFGDRASRTSASSDLIERLRARLGTQAVHGVGTRPEHRPEAAWRATEPGVEAFPEGTADMRKPRVGTVVGRDVRSTARSRPEAAPTSVTSSPIDRDRPLWLLPAPRPLELEDGQPCFDGRLELLRGPERIETGWWESDVTRDYYVAGNPSGVRLWIYRERDGARGWFLQGVFG
jgi:protein ImuB